MSNEMKVNGLGCDMMEARALKSVYDSKGNEKAQSLPPGNRISAYVVDEYPACPANWEHGSDKASSYFMEVREGAGMWLDFNSCRSDLYDIAVVVSVQGINSVTGKKTDKIRMEQYKTQCPVHKVDFHQDRYCPECKYKWPAQNYLATTGTPGGYFWLDGFRSADGVVRQYIFSADEAKGVAAKKIGNERVHAIGIAFYRSKKKKPVYEGHSVLRGAKSATFQPLNSQPQWYYNINKEIKTSGTLETKSLFYDSDCDSDNTPIGSAGPQGMAESINSLSPVCGGGAAAAAYEAPQANVNDSRGLHTYSSSSVKWKTSIREVPGVMERVSSVTPVKNYEVAAGARIDQDVYADPKDLDYWEEEPAGFIYINYTDSETLQKILKAGKRPESEEGFLADVPVGN